MSGGWEPVVPLVERIACAVLLAGLPWGVAAGRFDLLDLIFLSVWSTLIVGGCAWGIVRDTKDGVKW